MKNIMILCCVLIIGTLNAQSNIKVGEKAPDIHITDWIDNKPQDTLLKNKFIVLEFWASWCSPCIKAVPHMNALQDSFDRDDLYFISITDESPETAMAVLRRIPFSSTVVSDQTKKTHIEFGDGEKGLGAIPMTVLIDNRNIIQWVGRPGKLTYEVLEKFLSGTLKGTNTLAKTSSPEIIKGDIVINDDKTNEQDQQQTFYQVVGNPNIFYHFNLTRSFADSAFRNATQVGGGFHYYNYTLVEIIKNLSDWTDEQINIPDSLKDIRFSFIYKNVGSADRSSIITTIIEALNLQEDTVSESTLVYQVSAEDRSNLDTTAQRFSTQSNSGDNLIMKNVTITDMIKEINNFSPELIELKQSVAGSYDFVIKVNSLSEILKSLKFYGFSIQKVEKQIDKLKLDYQKN